MYCKREKWIIFGRYFDIQNTKQDKKKDKFVSLGDLYGDGEKAVFAQRSSTRAQIALKFYWKLDHAIFHLPVKFGERGLNIGEENQEKQCLLAWKCKQMLNLDLLFYNYNKNTYTSLYGLATFFIS